MTARPVLEERCPQPHRHEAFRLAFGKLNSLPLIYSVESLHKDLSKTLQIVPINVTGLKKHRSALTQYYNMSCDST